MTLLDIPCRPHPKWLKRCHPLTKYYPGRNSPELGAYLFNWFCSPDKYIFDPMIGAGFLWSAVEDQSRVYGGDASAFGYALAKHNLEPDNVMWDNAEDTRFYGPLVPRDLGAVIFSPPFPKSHGPGNTVHQRAMESKKSTYSVGAFTAMPHMPTVYARILEYLPPDVPMVVITRDYVEGNEVIPWSEDQMLEMGQAGFDRVVKFRRQILPTRWQQAKIKRDPDTTWIQFEDILVATRTTRSFAT